MTADAFIMKDGVDLSTEAQQVLGVVGLLAWHPFRPEMIAAAFQPSLTQKLWQRLQGHSHKEPNFDTIWHDLVQAGLLRRESYRLVLADEALYQAVCQLPVAEPIVKELVRIYEELARANEAMTDGHKQHLDAERPHILAILRLCQERKEWIPIRNIHISLRNYWPSCGNLADQIEAYEIRLAAAYGLGDRGEIARFALHLGDICYNTKSYEKAIASYQQALTHGTSISRRGQLLLRLGTAQMMVQQYPQALNSLHEANRISAETREDRQLAKCLMITGMVHAGLDEPVAGEQNYAQAIRMASALNDPQLEAEIERRLAQLYEKSQQREKAIDHFNRSLWLYQHLDDQREQILIHTELGKLHTEVNQEVALQHYGEALMLAYGLKDPVNLIFCSFNMGLAFYQSRQVRQAIIHFQEMLTTALAQKNQADRITALQWLGTSAYEVGDYQVAQLYFQEVQALLQTGEDRKTEIFCWRYLGLIAQYQREWVEAQTYHGRALQMAQESGDTFDQAAELDNLADVQRKQGQLDEALTLYEQTMTLLKQNAHIEEAEAEVLSHIACTYRDKGDIAAATHYFDQATTLVQETQNEKLLANCLWEMGLMYLDHDLPRAITLLRPRLHYYQKIEHTCADEDAAFVAEVESRLSP